MGLFANNFSITPSSTSLNDVSALSKLRPNWVSPINDIYKDYLTTARENRANQVKDLVGKTIAGGGSLAEANRLVDAMGFSPNDKARAKMQEFANVATDEQRKVQKHLVDTAHTKANTQSILDTNARDWAKHPYVLKKLALENTGLGLDNQRKSIDNNHAIWLNGVAVRDDTEARLLAGTENLLRTIAEGGKEALTSWANTPEGREVINQTPGTQKLYRDITKELGGNFLDIRYPSTGPFNWDYEPTLGAAPQIEARAAEELSTVTSGYAKGFFDPRFPTVDALTKYIGDLFGYEEAKTKDNDFAIDRYTEMHTDIQNAYIQAKEVAKKAGIDLPTSIILELLQERMSPKYDYNPFATTKTKFDTTAFLQDVEDASVYWSQQMPELIATKKRIDAAKDITNNIKKIETERVDLERKAEALRPMFKTDEAYNAFVNGINYNFLAKNAEVLKAIKYYQNPEYKNIQRRLRVNNPRTTPNKKRLKESEIKTSDLFTKQIENARERRKLFGDHYSY